MNDLELREVAKKNIETLEFWLRRIINESLTASFGARYWDAKDGKGLNVIKKDIREKVSTRIEKAPSSRFSRWIDATLIEHLIEVLYNNKFYEDFFREYFSDMFPINMPISASRVQLKFVLEKISSVRNTLYHANHVSVRQVEQTVCYTNDIIDSAKSYYIRKNKFMDFNVPSILSISDSIGNKFYANQLLMMGNKKLWYPKLGIKFRSGDRIKMSVEVDATFATESYSITWSDSLREVTHEGTDFEIIFDENWISEIATIQVRILSNKKWHKYHNCDDFIDIFFTVLPPFE